jgi:hypothetical protein
MAKKGCNLLLVIYLFICYAVLCSHSLISEPLIALLYCDMKARRETLLGNGQLTWLPSSESTLSIRGTVRN